MELQPSELGSALLALLSRRLRTSGEVRSLRRLPGSATKRTWAFDWARARHCDGFILQRPKEPASPVADVSPPKLRAEDDAAPTTTAPAAGVPAPELILLLEPQDGLGAGYVTHRAEGKMLGRRIVGDEAFAAARRVFARQCGQVLARIYQSPRQGVPYLQTLSPTDELQLYAARLDGMERQHAVLAYSLRWVRDHLPECWEWAVAHADFRTGNLIVGPEGLRCVLDWEIARINDQMQDLAVLCLRSWRFGGDQPVGGFGSRQDLYAPCKATGGERVVPEPVRFREVLNSLKWAISCVRCGKAKRADGWPDRVEFAAIGRRMEEPLWDLPNLTTA